MTSGQITWKTVKALLRQRWSPVDAPERPDHEPHWVMRGGVAELCCDQHFYPRDEPFPWR
jgi:hypothetical protein